MKKVLAFIMALVICMCSASFVFAEAYSGTTGESGDIEIDIGNNPGSGDENAIGTQGNPLLVLVNTTFRVPAGKTYHIVVKNKAGWKLVVSGVAGFKVNDVADTKGVYTAMVANADEAYAITNTTGTEQQYKVELVKVIPGDCNGDGEVDNKDVMLLLLHTLFGEEEYPLSCSGDINNDGKLSNADVIELLWQTLFFDEDA